MTHHPIGYCEVHGFFPVQSVAMGDGVNMTFHKVGTLCPRCKRDAEIVPGTYETIGDRLNLLLDPSISPEALRALQRLAMDAHKGTVSAEEAEKQAEKIHRGAGKLFNVADWSDSAKATVFSAIITSVSVIAAAAISSLHSPNVTVHPVIERVIPERPAMKNDFMGSTNLRPPSRPSPKHREKPCH
jgi:hypothetical protein